MMTYNHKIGYIIAFLLVLILSFFLATVKVKAETLYGIDWAGKGSDISIEEKIDIACSHFGCNSNLVKFVAKCESNYRMVWNPSGRNYGIFQYAPTTFDAYSYSAFSTMMENPDRSKISMYSVDHQVLTTAWAFANGKQRAWECYFKHR